MRRRRTVRPSEARAGRAVEAPPAAVPRPSACAERSASPTDGAANPLNKKRPENSERFNFIRDKDFSTDTQPRR